jgi:arylsulfatase A-like enzyme
MKRFLGALVVLGMWGVSARAEPPRPNVLFIAVDDLNHWVRHLDRNRQAITPHIDRLAASGVTFTNAYCAAPVCNASRAALMSGLRPSTTGVYENNIDWRPRIAIDRTLPTHFRKHGYWVAGAGKIYHGGFDRDEEWDEYFRPRRREPQPAGDTGVEGIRFAPLDAGDDQMNDYHIADFGIEQLGKPHDKPFFLAIGFHKPHMPWNVPRKYYDMYPLDKIELPPSRADDLDDLPPAAIRMAGPQGDHAAILKSGRWKDAIQGYLAAVTFLDTQVGRLLDALDRSPHRKNTVVVFWGDHGWHLGEKQHWRKFALWEEATRAPFIWIAPGVTTPGGVCRRTVDFMSIYPTLAELCGLPIPSHNEGASIRALLADPSAPWDRPALTTYHFMNHTLRTEQWRYIRYANGDEELYDETKDPYEWTNLAGKPEHASVKARLAEPLPKENVPEEKRAAKAAAPRKKKQKKA